MGYAYEGFKPFGRISIIGPFARVIKDIGLSLVIDNRRLIMFNYTKKDQSNIEYFEITPANDLLSGERLFVDIGETPIVIFNIAGEFFAIGDVCTHDDGPLGDGDVEDHVVICPRHGAEFDVRTGRVLSMPAVVDIPAYPVEVRNGSVFVGIPKE